MPSDDLWGVTTEAMAAVTGAPAWLDRMVRVEAALSAALAGSATTTPPDAREVTLDATSIAARARVAGTPVIPLVADLAAALGPGVHTGATSQDIVDTALMLTARDARAVLEPTVVAIGGALAALADVHRATVVPGRTLLQQGAPTSFGLTAAGWLVAFVDGWTQLVAAVNEIPAQLGGPVGTLGALGDHGIDVHRAFAAEMLMPEAVVPWHTNRLPIARLASALAILAGVIGKIAGDITLHAQTEIGELSERAEPGRGTSSAMPHKRNPVASVRAIAAARQVAPIAGGILSGMIDQPFQRAAGAWQAEVPALSSMYGLVAAALESLADALDGLHVDVERMRANLDPRGGWMAEAATVALTPHVGREAARTAVTAASDAARTNGTTLADELRAALPVGTTAPADVLDRVTDPTTLLGSASAFVDRALAHYRASELPA